MMNHLNAGSKDKKRVTAILAIAAGVMLLGGMSLAQQSGQKTFRTAHEAVSAMAKAAKENDERAMLEILGPGGKKIVSSGDEAEDSAGRANFVKRYEEMHRLVSEPDGETILYIGADNWPTPIPLMQKAGKWYFDTAAGEKEILYRRIGRNEMSTIRVCRELAAAEKEYSTAHGEYAAKIFSDDGKQNGLYWKATEGQPQSLVGPLLAAAVTETDVPYREGATTPFRGYFFHVLTKQGRNAPGGAKSYKVDGKMSGGFAFVAYPAEYRSSGVMTFIVGPDGIVYQKDLGKKTEMIASKMTTYDPTPGWQAGEDDQEKMASENIAQP